MLTPTAANTEWAHALAHFHPSATTQWILVLSQSPQLGNCGLDSNKVYLRLKAGLTNAFYEGPDRK